MDMAELAARTGMPVRKLRYVFDHRILSGLRAGSPGQGIPRTFTDFEAFGIALAARLLDTGLTRRLVAACLESVCRRTESSARSADVPLLCAYTSAGGVMAVGDGRYVRLSGSRRPGVGAAFDSGWVPISRHDAALDGYTPAVLVTVQLGGLAQMVRGATSAKG